MGTIIYALVDPRDELPHYVGCGSWGREEAWRTLQNQLRRGRQPVRPVEEWLADLAPSGMLATFQVLQELPGYGLMTHRGAVDTRASRRAARAERRAILQVEAAWIDYGDRKGWPLTNVVRNAGVPEQTAARRPVAGLCGPQTPIRSWRPSGASERPSRAAGG